MPRGSHKASNRHTTKGSEPEIACKYFEKIGWERGFEPSAPLAANQVLGFLNSSRERGGLFSKACKSLYRRRFKRIEDARFAAFCSAFQSESLP